MIFFDVTKSGGAGHRSGLLRVRARLADELGDSVREVSWTSWDRSMSAGDWFFTAELFSEEERPGFSAFLAARSGRAAAVFHDAIPLKWPQITWPQSVARHPSYMKMLAQFDRVWAVSAASCAELAGFWRWQGLEQVPPLDVLALGADADRAPRVTGRVEAVRSKSLISVGILEPRKNQALLLDVAETLWREGLDFELNLVGRVNPHFGRSLEKRVKALAKKFPGLRHHAAASDAVVAGLYADARASVFPTIAEGCGLPLLESLWQGVPCVCSDLPVLLENANGGGCWPVMTNDRAAWTEVLRRVLTDGELAVRLRNEARSRKLPTWAAAAETLRAALPEGLRAS
jgi:glycosyltransferase involved in cell wall biosynthesis